MPWNFEQTMLYAEKQLTQNQSDGLSYEADQLVLNRIDMISNSINWKNNNALSDGNN